MNLSTFEIVAVGSITINVLLLIVVLFTFITNFVNDLVRRWQDKKLYLDKEVYRRLVGSCIHTARKYTHAKDVSIRIHGTLPDWYIKELTDSGYTITIDVNGDTFIDGYDRRIFKD